MKITSLEIKQHEFEKSFRGYDIEEVNSFLSTLSQEWDRMLNESKMLKMQLEIAEKEASKLREVEMSLIKTLRTAEDTSSRITENARIEASNTIEEAEKKASLIISEAENQAEQMVIDAEQKSINIQNTAKQEFEDLERSYQVLEQKKANLISQLKEIGKTANELSLNFEQNIGLPITKTQEKISNVEIEITKEIIEEKIEKEIILESPSEELPAKELLEVSNVESTPDEEEEIHINFSSAVNQLSLETQEDKTNLELIEGIGPKIKEVLNNARIRTFRDLATTPIYRIKDILTAAGPQFSSHDPSTWVEQALLAEEGDWEKLDALKAYLIAGRKPKEVLPEVKATRLENNETNTEEMLDKVNKVKAAIRKAMVEKGEPKNTENTSNSQGGSFFDSLN